jgi:hypothetical protein
MEKQFTGISKMNTQEKVGLKMTMESVSMARASQKLQALRVWQAPPVLLEGAGRSINSGFVIFSFLDECKIFV